MSVGDHNQADETRAAMLELNLRILKHEAETPMRGHDEDGGCCLRARLGGEVSPVSAPRPPTGNELANIKARAEAAASRASGKRWALDENDTAVRANLGAGPTVCTTVPLGYETRRANAAHIAGMDPETTLRLVAEIERLRALLPRGIADHEAENALFRIQTEWRDAYVDARRRAGLMDPQ